MKPASAALVALLNSSTQFIMADLVTLTLQGGGQYLYSAAQTAITDQATGRVFALGPKFERSNTKLQVGTQVDELEIRLYPEPTDLLGATSWLQAAWTGEFDGASLTLERAFMPSWGDTTPGTVVLFSGRVSDIEASRTMLDLKCRSHLELLNIQMPRRLFQPSCNHVFGDAMCTFDRSSRAVDFIAAAGSTQTLIQGVPTLPTNAQYAQGSIVAFVGNNFGQTRTIAAITSGQSVQVKLAFLSPVNPGDTFQLLPGCDRTLATCTNIYANPDHFGGCPFVPPPENAV